jgi:hypothetical protein
MRALLPWFPMGATFASSTPVSADALAFVWSLMEVLHAEGGDETRLTCAQIGTRVRLSEKESEAALAELLPWTSIERRKRFIRWAQWGDAHLSDPKRAVRNRKYRQGLKERESPVSRDVSGDAGATSRETSRRRSTASPEEKRSEENRSEDTTRGRAAAPARPPAPARLGRLEPGPRPTVSGPVDLAAWAREQEGR